MKRLLLCPALLLGTALAAQAQLLPVPNTRNPDWALADTKLGFRPSGPDSLAGSRDRMPIASLGSPATRMPNALPNVLPNALSTSGTTQRYWNAERQLQYEWLARPGHPGPDSLVTVRQQKTGATYTYRKRPQSAVNQRFSK